MHVFDVRIIAARSRYVPVSQSQRAKDIYTAVDENNPARLQDLLRDATKADLQYEKKVRCMWIAVATTSTEYLTSSPYRTTHTNRH